MAYKVTQAVDYLDTNPLVSVFEEEWEALEFMNGCLDGAVQYRVAHSPYTISEKQLEEMHEQECTLVRIEEVNTIEMTLPVHWLSALINSDETGYEDDELKRMELFTQHMLKNYGNAIPLAYDLESENFTPYHDARVFGVLACNVCTVTFPITKKEEA